VTFGVPSSRINIYPSPPLLLSSEMDSLHLEILLGLGEFSLSQHIGLIKDSVGTWDSATTLFLENTVFPDWVMLLFSPKH
jgi:hypothetical protein